MNRNERILVGAVCFLCAAMLLFLSFSSQKPVQLSDKTVREEELADERENEVVFDLNRVSKEQLCLLPGIGEVLSERILEYRFVHGKFSSLEELLEIEGFSEKKLESVRGRLVIG